ncbi:hypothetical protein [Streptomyces cylindrosporus]|uniref:Uncharacterized protein n=1 Tax=Streptomyces cylindrosporus TaxID=2927583 RepID=A0ABS9Y4G8_9ACTN|nr:hypothetical protein [Streptomyces cylindrosporus]MCI3272122.1 hypothetical protein [Streptomyces cylindrosporus]
MKTCTATATARGAQLVGTPGRPARPAGYWERVDAIVNQAPPLDDYQRAVIRTAFCAPTIKEAA